ncbi:kinase-like protein [Gigaspora margarita]|uniref:Kinase-like protein n=1 Tax=Gigaspora margarita TaxID=4874 RepID=A0A8H4EJV7_GIGMA|nr:kinase-like protein [Gigaspora margarita]
MENPPKENERLKWFQKAIEDKLINFFDFTEFGGKEKIDDKGPVSVHKSEWTNYGLTVVLKGIKFDVDGDNMNSFVKELQTLQRVSFHPKINHFYGVTKDPVGSYMIVLHHANNGDLREYLNNNFSKLKWDDKYRIAGEISQGLAFLHNNDIAHRNLHTKNILVHNNKMMITDFDKEIIKELELLQNTTDHPNIIKFYGVTKDPSNEYPIMVLQYPEGEYLCDYLRRRSSELQWTEKISMAIELAEGLKYLHEHHVAHRGLDSKHIVFYKGKMLIAGFGIPEHISTSNSKTLGSPAYTDPQCLKEPTYKRDKRSDIYSFGVILWEISSGRPPFQSFESGYAITLHVFKGERELPVNDTPPQYEQLYTRCWVEDPEKRPDIVSILENLKQIQNALSETK